MDRIINNESVAICAILSALVLDVDDIARLNLFVVMTTDRAIRNRLVNYANYEEMVGKESSYYQALNRKFVEFQPVFLNAITMLLMGGKVEKTAEGKYSLTNEGNQMVWELQNYQEGVMENVRQAAIQLAAMIGQKDTVTWYKDLKIVL
jgi:hypothetical protein